MNDAEKRADLARKRRERQRSPQTYITWLDPPVLLHPAKRTMVVGVCSDASDDVKAMYL
jgi:hypothetical protein